MQTSPQSSPSNNVTGTKQQTQMQSKDPEEVRSQQQTQPKRRRRRRPRNRQKTSKRLQPKETDNTFAPSLSQETRLDLKDLTREAYALEKQLNELQTQLNINYANIPKDQGRRINAIAREQVTATQDEMDYVRKRLKTVYHQILTNDLLYASSQHVEDRLWRHIFYPPIEETRSRLRKLKPDDPASIRQKLVTVYYQYIDSSFKFYRDLNHHIKSSFHVDTKTIGIDVFRHQMMASKSVDEDKVAILLHSNYICMGDLARYRASFTLPSSSSSSGDAKPPSSAADAWKISKTCYQKAVDVYRSSGKPYSQLALVSASTGSVIDVVWYYTMSMAMKHPSTLGHDNLKSFYSKVRFTTRPPPTDSAATKPSHYISHFVESFLQMHHSIVFQKSDRFPALSDGLGLAMTQVITDAGLDPSPEKSTSSVLHIIRSTLTRTITIILTAVWYMGELMKDKANFSQRSDLQHLQMILLGYGFDVLTNLYKAAHAMMEQMKKTATDDSVETVSSMVDNTILPALATWCSYLYTNMNVIAQYCHGADGRNTALQKETTKRSLVRSMQTFCSFLIAHPSFPLPVNNVLPSTFPLSEDVFLLGLVPLLTFHSGIDFFKETAYEVDEQTTSDARKQVRWGRARDFIRKVAESTSFSFVQYNQVEQNYSVIDENAKRQQQSRFMKALATQRLMEQVSSLEKNVNKMTVSSPKLSKKPAAAAAAADQPMDIYTVIVDVTAFLDGLANVKRWANQTLNIRRRIQTSLLRVIVPLEVIDVLDYYKKGDSHMNLQARESIRYLDHQLADEIATTKTRSYLRTQKVDEKLGEWEQAAAAFWIGDSNDAKQVDTTTVLTDSDDVDDDASMSSDDDLFKSHGRGRQWASDDDDSEEEEDYSSDDDSTDDDGDDDGDDGSENEDVSSVPPPVSPADVPKTYRPLLSCLLYFYQQQQQQQQQAVDTVDPLVLVTNDDALAAWAERFGDPSTGKSISVYTVREWDRILNTRTFERAANPSRSHE